MNLITLANCCPNLTSGGRADRQSSLSGRRCLWLSSPFQKQGSSYCRLHSSLSPQRACRDTEGSQQTCSLDTHTHTCFHTGCVEAKIYEMKRGFICISTGPWTWYQINAFLTELLLQDKLMEQLHPIVRTINTSTQVEGKKKHPQAATIRIQSRGKEFWMSPCK